MKGLRAALGFEPGGQIFSPGELPGLVWWASADTLSGSPVSSWSYGAGNLTQGTGGSQPTWTNSSANVGNRPSVLYNGSQFMSAPSTSALQLTGDMTIVSVIYIVSYPTGFGTVISKGTSSEFDVYVTSAGTPTFANSNTGAVAGTAGSIATATKAILTVTLATTTVSFYVNGVAKGTATSGHSASTTNAVQLGQRSDAGTKLNGEQPQSLLYNRALSAAELQQVHRYFGLEYGISVP